MEGNGSKRSSSSHDYGITSSYHSTTTTTTTGFHATTITRLSDATILIDRQTERERRYKRREEKRREM